MHNVTLTGRIIHGPRIWFRDQEPHAELFLRTRTLQPGFHGGEVRARTDHHIQATGAQALELWNAQPESRLTVKGRLVWTTYPCEPEDCRTFVHVEAKEVERLAGSTGADRNCVELTAQLAQNPQPWDARLTQAFLLPRPHLLGENPVAAHVLAALAVGEAAVVLALAEAGETLTLSGQLQTATFEPRLDEVLLQATLLATAVVRSPAAAALPAGALVASSAASLVLSN